MTTKSTLTTISLAAVLVAGMVQADCPSQWTCYPVATNATSPTLDGNLSDWTHIVGISTTLTNLNGQPYMWDATFRCQYDTSNIYFALEIPGEFRFNDTVDEKCAAIGTMTKIGSSANFFYMGGCPDTNETVNCPSVPDTCIDYRVDIGAHWELSSTTQNTTYGIGGGSSSTNGTSSLRDEFAVYPNCRFPDTTDTTDSNAGDEWSGAWMHTNPVESQEGTYVFEISRALQTKSSLTDGKFTPGESTSFGVAFWDPFETSEGWNEMSHYVTGCLTNWIELTLKTANMTTSSDGGNQGGDTTNQTDSTNGNPSNNNTNTGSSGFMSKPMATLTCSLMVMGTIKVAGLFI